MGILESKKWEYWNHFVARWVIEGMGGGYGVTGPRLRKMRLVIWQDADFWWDVVERHGGLTMTPEEMSEKNPGMYEHCLGNFWGQVYQDLVKWGLVK